MLADLCQPAHNLHLFIKTPFSQSSDPNLTYFSSAGSSLKLCLVAEGMADIYPRLGPTMEWDTAAGQAIVEQAQGSVLNSETKEPLRYNKKNLLNSWFIVRKKAS